MEILNTLSLKYFVKIIFIIELIVVFPVPCPPANPTKKGFLLFAFFTIQKQTGIRKDLIIFSLPLNFSVSVSCVLINLIQSCLTLLKQSLTSCMRIIFFDLVDDFDHHSHSHFLI